MYRDYYTTILTVYQNNVSTPLFCHFSEATRNLDSTYVWARAQSRKSDHASRTINMGTSTTLTWGSPAGHGFDCPHTGTTRNFQEDSKYNCLAHYDWYCTTRLFTSQIILVAREACAERAILVGIFSLHRVAHQIHEHADTL